MAHILIALVGMLVALGHDRLPGWAPL